MAFAATAVLVAATIPPWLVAVAALVVVGGLVWSWFDFLHAGRMRNEYARFAIEHGWEFTRRTHRYNSQFWAFPFAQGSSRRQESVIAGEHHGVRCASFVHSFESSADAQRGVSQAYQVTLAELPVALPRVDIVPRTLGAQLAGMVSGQEIDFESHDFNRRWRVVADDARYAHAVIDPRMIERLLWHDAQAMRLRIEGGAVYVWQPGRTGVADLSRRLAVVCGVARRVPAHVIREYRELGHAARHGDAATRPLTGPTWATASGALTSRRYTGVGTDADGDGIEDWKQLPPLS